MNELFEAGKLVSVVDRVFRFDDLAAAFEHYGSGGFVGKVVVALGA